MLVDTHGHVNFQAFKDDADVVLKRALQNNIWVVMPGTQFSTSQKAIEMAERYPEGVYAAIGLHPIHLAEKRRVDEFELQSELPVLLETGRGVRPQFLMGFETKAEEFEYEKYKQLALSASKGKVVAIGEFGLDYYYEPKGKEKREAQRLKQKSALALQLKLAEDLQLPIILHCRKAHEDLLEILHTRYKRQNTTLRGVVHCYTGDLKQAEQFYNLGLYFGFNGLIFKDVPALPDPNEIIAALPLERILLETDSPYLAPSIALAKEGIHTERNEPLYVRYVAEEIARIKKLSIEEVASATTQNAKSLFALVA